MLSCLNHVHDGANIRIDMSTMICSGSKVEFNRKGMHYIITKEDFYNLLTSLSKIYESREKSKAQKDMSISIPLHQVRLVHSSLYMPYVVFVVPFNYSYHTRYIHYHSLVAMILLERYKQVHTMCVVSMSRLVT